MTLGRVIIVPLVSPETAPWLGRLAAMLAAEDQGLVVPVSVLTPDMGEEAEAQARSAVARAEEAAVLAGASSRGRLLTGNHVATAVLDAMAEDDATLALMGWQGRSTLNNVFGDLIDSIMGQATTPLAVVRPADRAFTRVLYPLTAEHLARGGERGVAMASSIVARLQEHAGVPVLLVRAGGEPVELPEHATRWASTTLTHAGSVDEALGDVAGPGDIIVTSVAPTTDGLRTATTRIAWATPQSWQLVALDAGPPTPVDVIAAVEGAGMVIAPRPDPDQEVPHRITVTVRIPGRDPDDDTAWGAVDQALRRIGSIVAHDREVEADGTVVDVGEVEVLAIDPGTALSATMLELDEVRWSLGAAELTYRISGAR